MPDPELTAADYEAALDRVEKESLFDQQTINAIRLATITERKLRFLREQRLEAEAKERGFRAGEGWLKLRSPKGGYWWLTSGGGNLETIISESMLTDLRAAGVTVSDDGVIDRSTLPARCGGRDWRK